ncbi:hypothetical protein GOODEAATRI_029482 [Goodea atripinnis]|uniref:Uncharacterized protein n=1 Tax=Goodea atripinnis TaxID=208336 RepID=A0ABV0PI23_9TELE
MSETLGQDTYKKASFSSVLLSPQYKQHPYSMMTPPCFAVVIALMVVQFNQFNSVSFLPNSHFISYTLLVPDWTAFCLQNCLNPSWHRLNKVQETFLREFGPY